MIRPISLMTFRQSAVWFCVFVLFGIGHAARDGQAAAKKRRAPKSATYYVSASGDDSNVGSIDQPFRTIAKAATVIRAGDTCLIRGGTYHEAVVIENIRGSRDKPITFKAYGDEEVTLDGSEAIAPKWTRHKGQIYKARLNKDIWQLFVNGKSASSARWPNANWDDGSMWEKATSMAWPQAENSLFGHHYNATLTELDFSMENGGIIVVNSGSFKTYKAFVTEHKAGSDNLVYDTYTARQHTLGFTTDRHGYFLEGKPGLLDAENEWFYEPKDSMLYYKPVGGANPNALEFRGKTQSYAFDVSSSSFVKIVGMNFFGTTVKFIDCSHVTVEDCSFLYPSYSKRMLRDISPMDVTKILVDDEFSPAYNTIRNCTFEYADGPALEMNGLGNLIENCYMHDIDYSCTYAGGFTLNMINSPELTFRRNTIHTTGTSEMFKAGVRNLIELNDLSRSGFLQNDGSMIQISVKQQDRSVTRYNWCHHTVKQGLRFDNSNYPGSPWGENGRMHHNVIWKTERTYFKGDRHFIHNNLGFDNTKNDLVIANRMAIQGRNFHTITQNNIAKALSGDINRPGFESPVPGIVDHNWSADEKGRTVRSQLRDPDNLDFRPRADSDLVDAGVVVEGFEGRFIGNAPDIGPYEYGDTNYWIPGRKSRQPSVPIPPNGSSKVKFDADLMWLGGYRALSHDVYFGTDKNAVAKAGPRSREYKGNQANNIFDPVSGDLDAGKVYYWRIDAVKQSGTVKGDVWLFTTGLE
ncbi:MAG: right-handed parallel beta-helix repeat-containing protein [Planctomycetes bacterium]|nr:right-handed parallel beta-helix repeat-containing protein [Planctomycetota bacterium]